MLHFSPYSPVGAASRAAHYDDVRPGRRTYFPLLRCPQCDHRGVILPDSSWSVRCLSAWHGRCPIVAAIRTGRRGCGVGRPAQLRKPAPDREVARPTHNEGQSTHSRGSRGAGQPRGSGGGQDVAGGSDYPLTQEKGPWLIVAASFSGNGAEKQANDLARELRDRFRMAAYVHEMDFKFGDETPGRGLDEYRTADPSALSARRSCQ